jgi:cell division protein FtsI/penicillin-binding protein 2
MLTFLLFSSLIVRFAYLQFVEGPSLQERQTSMITKGVSIPPIRGNIYDSAGQQIAYSISTQSLYFTFKTGFKQEAAEALAAKLV